MASSLFSLSVLALFLLLRESEPSSVATGTPPEISRACNSTRFPDVCVSSFADSKQVPQNPTPLQIVQSAISLSAANLQTAQSMVKSILANSTGSLNRTNAGKNCIELLGNSQYRISSTLDALPRGRNKDARAWMGAAMIFQYDCWSAFKYANDTSQTNETMSFLNTLIMISSNALSLLMAYDIHGNQTESWTTPKTERDGFWETPGSGGNLGFNGGFPSNLTADVIVCKDGSGGCYKTVQEAVNAAPDNQANKKFVIHIKEGVYEEIVRVPIEKKNVVFLGDGMGKTVITGSLTVGQPGVNTYESATVGVLGDGFMASGVTFQNAAGPPTHQAVAFRSDSDLSYIENCEFLGNQDTLYAHSLRQFYKSCRIQGNVDFIFGNSAAVFQDCQILVVPRQENREKGEQNAVTAHGRTDPAQSTGFVFQNCSINGTAEYMALYNGNPKVHRNYLGRPWKEYSRVVYINCNFESLITADGWMPWSGDFALNTLYYGEYKNSGPGSNLSQRVTWSSQIPAEHVNTYSAQNFIQGDEWMPTSS
ncbi:probable pectinesterase/pectinesterase inhibitor 51 isoform X3 [Hevea brasiliensis]|uniref:probable pectinesterase/pectinesterase inhibitor 51 isoform X3 n=1 Tax=Hevea brasiliensis TaxID=3981 RepID=UPI0025DD239C|nr:probable pectinesterase/pectinesterase inhibitor 51 isoform X3 [Hevea brasiliensis]